VPDREDFPLRLGANTASGGFQGAARKWAHLVETGSEGTGIHFLYGKLWQHGQDIPRVTGIVQSRDFTTQGNHDGHSYRLKPMHKGIPRYRDQGKPADSGFHDEMNLMPVALEQ
jgi:hypothetical protein